MAEEDPRPQLPPDQLVTLIVQALRESGQSPQTRHPPTQPLMLDPSDKLFDDLDNIKGRISDLSQKVDRMSDTQKKDHELLTEHDKILVRGTEMKPSLQETIRQMSKEQTDFIEGIKKDRAEAKKEKDDQESQKKEDRIKWKWAIIGLILTLGPKTLGDIITFWITIVKPALHIP